MNEKSENVWKWLMDLLRLVSKEEKKGEKEKKKEKHVNEWMYELKVESEMCEFVYELITRGGQEKEKKKT